MLSFSNNMKMVLAQNHIIHMMISINIKAQYFIAKST